MKNILKSIIIIIIIIGGMWYISGYIGLELEGRTQKENTENGDKLSKMNNSNLSSELVLVNSKNGLDKDYIPKKLTVPNIPFSTDANKEEKQVAGIIVKPLEKLVNTAKKEGIELFGNSGYRSYKSQESTYKGRVQSEGKKSADAYVAKPGFSEHQTGLCIDITNRDKYFVRGTKEAEWLEDNCYRFGFIIRYPYGKKNITSIEHEPWHIRYVGEKAAKYIHNNGITLEEYLGK